MSIKLSGVIIKIVAITSSLFVIIPGIYCSTNKIISKNTIIKATSSQVDSKSSVFPQQILNYQLDECVFKITNQDIVWSLNLVSVSIECVPANDAMLLQYFSLSQNQGWAFINRGQLVDLIANVNISFTFHQHIYNFNSSQTYDTYPVFATKCYDENSKIIYAPYFTYTDSNLYGIDIPSKFQISGHYSSSDQSTSIYIANALMASWDNIHNKMISKIDCSNIPDNIDKKTYTFGWDLQDGQAFYNSSKQCIATPKYSIVLS